MLRKRLIEEVVRASLTEGVEQVVIIGAGFDTLALRLCAGFPRTNFIEIDHPATQSCTLCHNDKSPTWKGFDEKAMVEKIAHPDPKIKH